MRFTERNIERFKTSGKRNEITDSQHTGFILRVSESGRQSFCYKYMLKGKRRRLTIGVYPAISLADALLAYEAARNSVLCGIDPIDAAHEATRNALTISQLADHYIDLWAKPNKRSWREDQRILNKDILPILGKHTATSVTRRDVVTLLDELALRAPALANKVHALLSKFFNFAIEREYVTANPCAMVRKPTRLKARTRVLDQNEIKQHWHGIRNDTGTDLAIRLALLFQLVTAQRKTEILQARWPDLVGDIWTIPENVAKNGVEHRVPLSTLAMSIIEEARQHSTTTWVFHPLRAAVESRMSDTTPDHALRRYIKRSNNAKSFTPHDLRRTAATNMASLGINRMTLMKVLNHSDRSTTSIYDRYGYDNEKRAALELWAAHLDALVTQ